MLLKEFDLDLAWVKNEEYIATLMAESGCSLGEAGKQDYDTNWKWKRFDFSLQVRCMCSFFERLFPRIHNEHFWKVMVLCKPIEGYEPSIRRGGGGVCEVSLPFDYQAFMNLDDYRKKKMTVQTLRSGINDFIKNKGMDSEPFTSTFNKIIDANYENVWLWKKPKTSPNRKHKAQILLEHEVEKIDISAIISNRQGEEITRKLLVTERPDEWFYKKYLGELKWLDNETVALISKRGGKEFIASI